MSSDIKNAVDKMADFFLANTRAEKVFREFPRPDQNLVTPSISIQTVRTDFTPRMEQILDSRQIVVPTRQSYVVENVGYRIRRVNNLSILAINFEKDTDGEFYKVENGRLIAKEDGNLIVDIEGFSITHGPAVSRTLTIVYQPEKMPFDSSVISRTKSTIHSNVEIGTVVHSSNTIEIEAGEALEVSAFWTGIEGFKVQRLSVESGGFFDAIKHLYTTQLGEYVIQLKFDLWGKYKTERDGLYQDIRDIFRSDTIQLEMGGQANPIMQLQMKSLNYLDSPEYAASGVWRTNLEMEANFDRLIVDDLPSIEEVVTMDNIS